MATFSTAGKVDKRMLYICMKDSMALWQHKQNKKCKRRPGCHEMKTSHLLEKKRGIIMVSEEDLPMSNEVGNQHA